MLHVKKIDSLDLPELQPYRTMRRQQDHQEQGIFVAEGEKVVRRLLESKFSVISVLLPEKWLRELESGNFTLNPLAGMTAPNLPLIKP